MKTMRFSIHYIFCVMETWRMWDSIRLWSEYWSAFIKCTDKLYGVKEHYFILPFIFYHVTFESFFCHFHLLHHESYWNSDMFLVTSVYKPYDISILKHTQQLPLVWHRIIWVFIYFSLLNVIVITILVVWVV